MNELLQKHGCTNVFHIPEGLKELMADITREVLRAQPACPVDFIADYLSALLITREHGLLSVRLLEDLCDCKPSVNEHLLQLDIDKDDAETLADIIKETIENFDIEEGKEKINETELIKKILHICVMDSDMATKICHIARNAFRDYCYRKSLQKKQKKSATSPWEIAAEHTLQIYKRTKPSFSEISRAAQKIQAAYRGYHTRRHLLKHLDHQKQEPKKELPGAPIDAADSREIDLGPCLDLKVQTDDINAIFDAHEREKLNLTYDPNKVLPDGDYLEDAYSRSQRLQSRMISSKSMKQRMHQGAIKVETPHDEIQSLGAHPTTPAETQPLPEGLNKEMDENDLILHYAKDTTTESILQVTDKSDKINVPIEDKKPAKISITDGDSHYKPAMKKSSTEDGHKIIIFSRTDSADKSGEKEQEFHQMIKHKLSIADAVRYKIIDDDDD